MTIQPAGSDHAGIDGQPQSNRSSADPIVDATSIRSCIIEPDDFVADTAAFVDVRLPRSAGKASYSFIGPGVSQNPDQTVNITTPHGFNVGAASMPHGVVNNPHLHFTAEVFLCTAGRWRFDIGERGGQSLDVGPGSIFSVPTWVFRGFENVGDDDGWLFTVLGRDETGGILWAPWVLEEAAMTGLALNTDQTVVDTTQGERPTNPIAPLDAEALSHIDDYSDAALAARLVCFEDLDWSDRALLSSALDGHECRVAPVIGFGMSEDRAHRPPIVGRHGFSVEWLTIEPGCSTAAHRHWDSQVLFVVGSGCELRLNRGDQAVASPVGAGAVVSIPSGTWRDVVNRGDEPLQLVVVNGGDGPTTLEWAPEVSSAAADAGWSRDANGCLAPVALVG